MHTYKVKYRYTYTYVCRYNNIYNKLLDRISKQGSQMRHIKILLNKKFGHYFEVFSKFSATTLDFHILFNCKYELKYILIVTLCLIFLRVFILSHCF